MTNKIYDLIIIGGGPAGCSAAVYASRKRMNTLLILKEWGGQSTVSEDIQNWIGTPHISGMDLAKSFKSHVMEYKSDVLDILEGNLVLNIEKSDNIINVITDKSDNPNYQGKSLLIATGSNRRKLDISGADEFEHKGLTYCASCDGPLFSGQDVVVIGGGNAGFESAAQLVAYCNKVYLLNRGDMLRADEITVEKMKAKSNFELIMNAIPKEVLGDKFVNGLIYTDNKEKTDKTLNINGIFIEIGQIPATNFAKNICEIDEFGRVKIDPWTQKTNTAGIWAAGDCTNILYHQNNIASGDAVRAIEDIYQYIH